MSDFICGHTASYDAGLCCGKTPCTIRAAPSEFTLSRGALDLARAEERARIVAYLRSEAPASSCKLAMMHLAEAIERGEHATAPDPHLTPG